uniref:Uncharacterized protein n=1 Tax=Anguilla anguilla TaxID=7936 RepID=A0A0E9RER3_ANGAN
MNDHNDGKRDHLHAAGHVTPRDADFTGKKERKLLFCLPTPIPLLSALLIFFMDMFLKVAQVLLVDVLCSKMAELLISSPTFSVGMEPS